MQRARVGLIVAVLGMMAVWGCGQDSAERAALADRETRLTKAQEELHALSKARGELEKNLIAAKAEIEKLRLEIEGVIREKESLQQQLAIRTAERDTTIAQMDQFRTNLRALLGQMDAALPTKPVGVTAAH